MTERLLDNFTSNHYLEIVKNQMILESLSTTKIQWRRQVFIIKEKHIFSIHTFLWNKL